MRADRQRYIPDAKEAHFRVVGYFMRSSIADALERNRARPDAKNVPERAVVRTHERLEVPSLAEGFDELFSVRLDPLVSTGFIVEPWRADAS
jgi:hypothetical protein